MRARLVLLTAAPLLASACVGPLAMDSDPCPPLDGRPAVVTEPQVGQTPEGKANLGLDVSSSLADAMRVTVRFDGEVALDVLLPAVSGDCAHPPVYRYAYRLPARKVSVVMTTGSGERARARIDLGAGKRWAVVQLQEGFPTEVEVSDEEPGWG